MTRLEAALAGMRSAREYTRGLLEGVGDDDWFRMPSEGVTHIAWQVGHLAIAEYRLMLAQVRGTRPDDERFIPASYVKLFGRGSTPSADASAYPSPRELRDVLDEVHQHALAELSSFPHQRLDLPPEREHRLCKTKLDCLEWCARHEMLHAGQIGLLKRLLGKQPVW
jgi:DinB superfamily